MKAKRFIVILGKDSETIAKIITHKYMIGLNDYFIDLHTGEKTFDYDLVEKAKKWVISQLHKWSSHPGPHEIVYYSLDDELDFVKEVVFEMESNNYKVFKLKTECINENI